MNHDNRYEYHEGAKAVNPDTVPSWISQGAVLVGDEILKRDNRRSLARKAGVPEDRIICIDNRILLKLTATEKHDLLMYLSHVLDREVGE